jgi:hypothetical protein
VKVLAQQEAVLNPMLPLLAIRLDVRRIEHRQRPFAGDGASASVGIQYLSRLKAP